MATAPGQRQPDHESEMSPWAAKIAISEISNVPLEQLCGYVLITVRHAAYGGHELVLMVTEEDYAWAADILEMGAADARSVAGT